MTRVLVVGGCGFIGRRLSSRLLELGHQVSILDRSPVAPQGGRTTCGDVRDSNVVRAAVRDTDCVVCLAAERRHDLLPTSVHFDVTVGGAENIVTAAVAENVRRVVFVSSAAVYGTGQPVADETTPLHPETPYGNSKALAEKVYARWAGDDPQRSLLIVRPAVTFGEAPRGNVHALAEQIRRRRFVMVGSGRNRKSMAYVGNLVEFLARGIEGARGCRVFNYADGYDLSTEELVGRLATLLGVSRLPLRAPPAAAIVLGHAFDALALLTHRTYPISATRVRAFCAETRISTQALQQCGFVAPFSLDEGLARMVASCFDASLTQRF